MSGRKLPFVSASVCEAVLDPGDVINRIEEVFHWHAEGSIISAKPSAMRINCDVPTFKSHTKAVGSRAVSAKRGSWASSFCAVTLGTLPVMAALIKDSHEKR